MRSARKEDENRKKLKKNNINKQFFILPTPKTDVLFTNNQ